MNVLYVFFQKLGLLLTSGAVVGVWMGALKILLVSLIQIGLTTVLIYVFFTIKTYMITFLADKIIPLIGEFALVPVTINVVGIGAWFGGLLRLGECFAALMSALVITFTLKIVLRSR